MSDTTIDTRRLIDDMEALVAAHRLDEPGAYCRWTRRESGLNPYGCADAANLLYTIGRLPADHAQRRACVDVLRGMQDAGDGLFREPTHHGYHCTAHCVAALELFDARPVHPLRALHFLLDDGAIEEFLENLDWRQNPWSMSHRGAGVYAALVIAGEASPEWQDRYFRWLWQEADETTGFWRRDCVPREPGPGDKRFPHLAGTFHYLFNHEHARRPLRYPRQMIDSCLDIRSRGLYRLCSGIGFAEIDWVYCLTRSLRQCGHRFDDCQTALRSFARQYTEFLMSLDLRNDQRCDDLHGLFGVCCALAELQQALPHMIRTERPLKLVLDRRPFI